MWDEIFCAGAGLGVRPCGLGALRTLRMEKKFPLYGLDIDETTSPLEAGLDWTVKFDKADFLGKAALIAQKAAGVTRKLCGLRLNDLDCWINRGDTIEWGTREEAIVSSAESGYAIGSVLALGYLPAKLAADGVEVAIVTVSGEKYPARVFTKPPSDPGRNRALA
jgi:aminomethyltransferase